MCVAHFRANVGPSKRRAQRQAYADFHTSPGQAEERLRESARSAAATSRKITPAQTGRTEYHTNLYHRLEHEAGNTTRRDRLQVVVEAWMAIVLSPKTPRP